VRFAWDPVKARSNFLKHGVSFELAITTFDDPFALRAPDTKHSSTESREWLIGESDDGVLVIIFTLRSSGSVYRLISARRANSRERQQYEHYKNISI